MITRKPPVDWFRILAELRRCGISQSKVAQILQVPRSRVRDWAYGLGCPKYDDGRALLMLWRRAQLSINLRRSRVKHEHGHDSASEQMETTTLSASAVELP